MTPLELHSLLAERRITRAALAAKLGVDERTVRRWLAGDTAIPKAAAIAIRSVIREPKKEKSK